MGKAPIPRELDLSKKNCHVCGNPLWRDIAAETEECICPYCQIRRVKFTIPNAPEQSGSSQQNKKSKEGKK